ncbi:MAG: hypothetical protein K2H20_02855, partial [Bacilli bacterium]|nr:hypothetical protein [Bacilli bacterium]
MFNKEKNEFNTLSEFENRDIQKVVKVQSYEECKYGIEFSKLKKGLIIFGLSIFLLNSLYKKKMYVPQVNINMVEDEFSYFAEYSLGKVYICKDEDFDRYKLLLKEN